MNMKNSEAALLKGLLEPVILNYLRGVDMHGYQLISTIRKDFHVYFGPSTIYPALHALEVKGCIKSTWDISTDRPRKVYTLTPEGEQLLGFLESCIGQVFHKFSVGQTEKKPILVKA